MANDPTNERSTQSLIKEDLVKLFRENGIDASPGFPDELASMLTDSIRTGIETTMSGQVVAPLKPKL